MKLAYHDILHQNGGCILTNSKTLLKDDQYPYAVTSRIKDQNAKLIVFNHNNRETTIEFTSLRNLIHYLDKGDVVVVNDSGVIPASFQMTHLQSQSSVEIRLVEHLGNDQSDLSNWKAYIFGEGDWTIKTEDRPSPPELKIGDVFKLGSLEAVIVEISETYNQLIELQFMTPFNLWDEIYKYGHLIQYSYLQEELKLWDQQTIFSTRPLSVEAPSASFQLTWQLMFELLKKGVELVPITHAISLSSTGNQSLDEQLPFPEKYWISEDSANRINSAIQNGTKIIAFGTSVMRAIESSIVNGLVTPGKGRSTLIIDKLYKRSIFTGILTGMHIPGESHMKLLTNFIDRDLIEEGYSQAVQQGFLWHEYGDLSLILVDKVDVGLAYRLFNNIF